MKILLADDHALFRGGIAQVLLDLDEQVEIIETANVDEVLLQVNQQDNIDLALIDLNMPGKNGFEAITLLSEQVPTLPIVIISASENPNDVKNAMALGAMGFISKNSKVDLLLAALKTILSGQIYFPQILSHSDPHSSAQLTNRQLDVLKLMTQGLSNKVIANELNISEATVKMHVTAIFRHLHVSNRTQAVLKAKTLNLNF